jgi:chromosome segregation ATPase
LIASLKKNRTIVSEVASLAVRETASLAAEIDTLLEQVTQLQQAAAEKHATEEALDEQIADLEGQLAAEQQEKRHMDSTWAAQNAEATKGKAQHQQLEKALREAGTDLEQTKEKLVKTEVAIRDTEATARQRDTQLKALLQEQEKALAKLAAESASAGDQAKGLQAKYQALRFLIQQQIVTSPEVKVALELKNKETATVGHLQNATFLNRLRVIEVLEKLAKRGVVRFGKDTGEVTVLRSIDL